MESFFGSDGAQWVSSKAYVGCHWQHLMGLESMLARLCWLATAQRWLLRPLVCFSYAVESVDLSKNHSQKCAGVLCVADFIAMLKP